MYFQVKVLIFTTGWMVFRAVGSGLFLTLGAIGSERSASSDWTIAFLGDFVIGTTALFLAYNIWKKPSALLWGILLAWNAVGSSMCYRCKDDTLSGVGVSLFDPSQPYGFYRKPLGNNDNAVYTELGSLR